MNIQQMMMQAQKMQRELKKALGELTEKEFIVTKSGAVTVTVLGNKTVKSVSVDKDAFDAENKEMVEDLIALAINEALAKVQAEEEAINERITGKAGGLGF
ncbi:MAG: YbaB/EbfC family nucleoid-associated protein [Erysipelotrichaceae bacterium]|jgi:DNA-binding YbaB/EbfC family protein|nr:YbaB/EbfC family nucleoid-associated protein [Erysipelotrichaceae bacterium]